MLLADRRAKRLGQLGVDGELRERGLEVAPEAVVHDAERALQHGEQHGILGLERRLAQVVAAGIDDVAGAPERRRR